MTKCYYSIAGLINTFLCMNRALPFGLAQGRLRTMMLEKVSDFGTGKGKN